MEGKNLKMFFSLAPSFFLIFSCYSVEIFLYFAGLTISSMSGIQVSWSVETHAILRADFAGLGGEGVVYYSSITCD